MPRRSSATSRPSLPNAQALWAAVQAMDVDTVDRAIDGGAPLDVQRQGRSLVHLAACQGNAHGTALVDAMLDRLLTAGLSIDGPPLALRSPLQEAVERSDAPVVDLLIGRKASVHRLDPIDDRTLLHVSAQSTTAAGQRIARALVQAGLSPAFAWRNGKTPLHHAASARDADSIRLFLRHGATVNAQDHEGLTALHELATTDSTTARAAVDALLAAGANLEATDRQGRTPLHRLAEGGLDGMRDHLLDRGARLDARDDQGRTVLDRMRENPVRWGPWLAQLEQQELRTALDATKDQRSLIPARTRPRL